MSVLTHFFNLIKPAKTDGVKVQDFNANMDIIDTEMHKPPLTVNGVEPNPETRNLELTTVPLADNLTSDDAQFNIGTYLERTSGGSTPVHDGDAFLSTIKGNQVKTGYIPEVIDLHVYAVPREAPQPIEATLDASTFETFVEVAGTYTLTYDGTEWSASPSDYGLTIANDPVDGDEIVIYWDGTNNPEMTVDAVPRQVPPAITAQLSVDVWRAYVPASGTYTFTYTSGWSANLSLYGITVQNDPVAGDEISVDYVKLNRGTITTAAVTSFNSTGWNLYNNDTGIARVIKYSDDYGYMVGGNYSVLQYSETAGGTGSIVTVENGYFNIPADGFITVIGGDATTYIFPTWTDWVEGYPGDFEAYQCDTITLSGIMTNFPAGLCAIGETRDEINFNIQRAISRIQRIPYTDADLEAIIASGRAYDTDTNYIYVVRETPSEYVFDVPGAYTVSDHGIEFFLSPNSVPVVCETVYGQNLKDKLRMDVLTISQQTLTAAQQAQARANIGAAWVDNIIYHDLGEDTVANIETALLAFGATMNDGEQKRVTFVVSAVSGAFAATRYYGIIIRVAEKRFVVQLQRSNNYGEIVTGTYVTNAWLWESVHNNLVSLQTTVNGKQDTVTTTSGTASKVQYRKWGQVVFVRVYDTITGTANSWVTAGTLPSGYRPSAEIQFPGVDNSSDAALDCKIKVGGDVQIFFPSGVTSKQVRLFCTFIL